MEFGSEYVYLYDDSDTEDITEEYRDGLQRSTSDGEEASITSWKGRSDLSFRRGVSLIAELHKVNQDVDTSKTSKSAPPYEYLVQESTDSGRRAYIVMEDKPKLRQLQQLKGRKRIVRIIDNIAFKWESAAIALGFTGADVERIKRDAFYHTRRAATEMFTEWLAEGDKNDDLRTPVTWSTVVECLKDAELTEVANLLECVIDEKCSVSFDSQSEPLIKTPPPPEATSAGETTTNTHFWPLSSILKMFSKPSKQDKEQSLLQRSHPYLIEKMYLPHLLPHLNVHGVITDEEHDYIKSSSQPHREQIIAVLSIIEGKGESIVPSFIHALLDEKKHPGHKELARRLSKEKGAKTKAKLCPKGISKCDDHQVIAKQMSTNILSVTFKNLGNFGRYHTGDVVRCTNEKCCAVLSFLSKVTGTNDKRWICEFCGTANTVSLVQEEIPTSEEVTYLLSSGPLPSMTDSISELAVLTSGIEESILIFCVDVSGSMCVTSEVSSKAGLIKDDERLSNVRKSVGAKLEEQYLPKEDKSLAYISRLQSVQHAVNEQLANLKTSHPKKRIAIVTFSDEVTVFGDGNTDDVVIAGDKLLNAATLIKIGVGLPIPASISKSVQTLERKLLKLEEGGQTALGPALLVSVLFAAKIAGSEVIICTDGLANKGLGNLEGFDNQCTSKTFYDELGTIALDKGVTVSIVSIKGEQCRLMELGNVASTTGGKIFMVDPCSVAKEFRNILANPVIATEVKCVVNLHKKLYLQSERSNTESALVDIGNVTAETQVSFEYGVQKDKGSEAFSLPSILMNEKPYLPFQLLTEYKIAGGLSLLRVITIIKPVTRSRSVSEKNVNITVVGHHALQTCAKFAADGKYKEARILAIAAHKLLLRSGKATFSAHLNSIENLERTLKEQEDRLCSVQVENLSSKQTSQAPQLNEASVRQSSSLLETTVSGSTPHYRGVSLPSRRLSAPLTSARQSSRFSALSTDSVARVIHSCRSLSGGYEF